MPAITLKGHMSAGHDGFPPRPSVEGCPSVTVGGIPVHCEGQAWAPHSNGGSTHAGYLAQGAPHVSIAGRGVGRVGDPITCGDRVAQGCSNVTVGNCGGEDFGRDQVFGSLTDPKDKLILCLPEMANAEAERANERDKKGWIYLAEFAQKWMAKKAYVMRDGIDKEGNYDLGGQNPSWVEWGWMTQYLRFIRTVEDLIKPEYIFSPAALAKLASILEKDGLLTVGSNTFDHASLPWACWRSHAFQSIGNDLLVQGLIFTTDGILPDGLLAALGSFNLFALASGSVVAELGIARITIQSVSVFLYDGFDFTGEQWLGNWKCDTEDKGFSSHDTFLENISPIYLASRLDNHNFRNFRQRTGYGCDFRVLSPSRLVWEGEKSYVVP